MRHIPVIYAIEYCCENHSLGSASSCASLDYLDGDGDPDSLPRET